MEGVLLDPGQLARAAVDIASDKKASDVILLDIRAVSYTHLTLPTILRV